LQFFAMVVNGLQRAPWGRVFPASYANRVPGRILSTLCNSICHPHRHPAYLPRGKQLAGSASQDAVGERCFVTVLPAPEVFIQQRTLQEQVADMLGSHADAAMQL